jgi:hypothetical protein
MIASTSTGADADAVLAGAVLDDPPVTPPNEGDGAPPAGFAAGLALEASGPVATAPEAALEILDHIFPKMLMRYLAVRESEEGLTVGKDGAGIAGSPSTIRLAAVAMIARATTTFGLLKLTLGQGSYSWEFVPVAGQIFRDTGTGSCH